MAKIKRLEKVETHIYMTRLEDDVPVSKHLWMCFCGRVWLMRNVASTCADRGHKDFVMYGKRRVECVRKENPLNHFKGKDAYRAVQYEAFEKLDTTPSDWVWSGQMTDLGPIRLQLAAGGGANLASCDICDYAPLRYIFSIETVEWLVDLDTREKIQKMVDFASAMSWARELGDVDMKKFEEQKGVGTIFRFDGRHNLGIGSECITNYMLATPLLREQFEEVKKKIDKAQRDARAKKKAKEFAERFPDIQEMLDELRSTDEILHMKFEDKWDFRLRKYMPQPTGVHKGKSVVYRMEKALRKRGCPSEKVEKAFVQMWENREQLRREVKELEQERQGQRDKEEQKLKERASANADLIKMVEETTEKARYNPEKLNTRDESFLGDMSRRLQSRPDYRVSEKQHRWIEAIHERVFGKKLEGQQKSVYDDLMAKLSELGVMPSEWESEFLKTVAGFVKQGRDLTPKMGNVWTKMLDKAKVAHFVPKDYGKQEKGPDPNAEKCGHCDKVIEEKDGVTSYVALGSKMFCNDICSGAFKKGITDGGA